MSTQQDNKEPAQCAQPTTELDAHRQRVFDVRERLAKEFSIDTIYVGVPKLSRIIGIAPSTIYGYMRRGEFFMPYRMINTTAMISLDDIAEWHCSSVGVIPAMASAPTPKATAASAFADATSPTLMAVAPIATTPAERASQLVGETLREMGLPRSRGARPR